MTEIELTFLQGSVWIEEWMTSSLSEKRYWHGGIAETTKMQKLNGNLRLKMLG